MKKRKVLYWMCVMLYIAGVAVFVWPDLYRLKAETESRQVIQTFETESDAFRNGETFSDELYQKMKNYNSTIFENGQSDLRDPWSMEQEVLDLESYGVTDGLIGVISIPKMEIELPVYLGAAEENMSRGAVLLGQTSFPMGGENINSVIAAHRGWKGSPMFRDIEVLEIGDQVMVQNLWETLTYQVTEIRVIMPDDIGQVLIQEEKNMVTLLTCHPYTDNSRRYAVYCEQIAGEKTEISEMSIAEKKNAQANQVRTQAQNEDGAELKRDVYLRRIGYIVIIILGMMVVFCGTERRKRKK